MLSKDQLSAYEVLSKEKDFKSNLFHLGNLVEEKLHRLYMSALNCFVERGSTSAVLGESDLIQNLFDEECRRLNIYVLYIEVIDICRILSLSRVKVICQKRV